MSDQKTALQCEILRGRLQREARAMKAQLDSAIQMASLLRLQAPSMPSRASKNAIITLAQAHSAAGEAINRIDTIMVELEDLSAQLDPNPPKEVTYEHP